VQQDQRVLQEFKVRLEPRVLLAPQEPRVQPDYKDQPVLLAHKDLQEQLALLERRVHKDRPDQQVRQVHKGQPGLSRPVISLVTVP
jgi:hypothetical protein